MKKLRVLFRIWRCLASLNHVESILVESAQVTIESLVQILISHNNNNEGPM